MRLGISAAAAALLMIGFSSTPSAARDRTMSVASRRPEVSAATDAGALEQRQEPSLPQPREETAAAAVDGGLYVIGGYDAAGQDTNSVYVFDGRRWKPGPPLPLAVDHPAAAVVAGHLYVAGGFSGGVATDRTFTLSPSGRAWTTTASLHHARGALALVAVGTSLYAIGGKESDGREVTTVEVYRLASRRWTDSGTLANPRDHAAGFAYRGWACAAGGRTPNTARVDCYDPGRRSWHRLPDLPVATSGAGATAYRGEVLVGGGELAGEGGKVIAQLARFVGGRWRADRMLIPRHGIEFEGDLVSDVARSTASSTSSRRSRA